METLKSHISLIIILKSALEFMELKKHILDIEDLIKVTELITQVEWYSCCGNCWKRLENSINIPSCVFTLSYIIIYILENLRLKNIAIDPNTVRDCWRFVQCNLCYIECCIYAWLLWSMFLGVYIADITANQNHFVCLNLAGIVIVYNLALYYYRKLLFELLT